MTFASDLSLKTCDRLKCDRCGRETAYGAEPGWCDVEALDRGRVISKAPLWFQVRCPICTTVLMREGLRLTQAEVAKVLGVSRVTLARWENGTRSPSRQALDDLQDFYESYPSNVIYKERGLRAS